VCARWPGELVEQPSAPVTVHDGSRVALGMALNGGLVSLAGPKALLLEARPKPTHDGGTASSKGADERGSRWNPRSRRHDSKSLCLELASHDRPTIPSRRQRFKARPRRRPDDRLGPENVFDAGPTRYNPRNESHYSPPRRRQYHGAQGGPSSKGGVTIDKCNSAKLGLNNWLDRAIDGQGDAYGLTWMLCAVRSVLASPTR
jgi:hypothetical protein